MEKKNLVVVGYGGMGGGYHAAKAIEKGVVNLLGIYDIDPAKSELARSRGIFAYDTYEDVLADDRVDIITVAIPNDRHFERVTRALEAGKHVICEKPVAMSSEEYAKMVECAEKNNCVFSVHQNRRWDVDFLAMKQIYNSGEIGKVFNYESRIHGSRGIPSDWRGEKEHGGGMLLDWGVHLIDQALQLFKQKITGVYCKFIHTTNFEVDDGYKLYIYFEDGAQAYIETGTFNFIALPRMYMQGDKGTTLITDWREKAKVTVCKHWHESDVIPVQTGAGLTKTMAPRDSITVDEYEIERPTADVYDFYRNFCDVIDGKAELIVKSDEVMRVMKVMEAAFKSDELGQVVAFEE